MCLSIYLFSTAPTSWEDNEELPEEKDIEPEKPEEPILQETEPEPKEQGVFLSFVKCFLLNYEGNKGPREGTFVL